MRTSNRIGSCITCLADPNAIKNAGIGHGTDTDHTRIGAVLINMYICVGDVVCN